MGHDRIQTIGEVDYWRQTDIVTPDELPAVTVIGAGGIGSFTLLALAKMGVRDLTVYDADKVEEHNIPNQLYRLDHVGRYKVDAVQDSVYGFTGVEIHRMGEMFTSRSMTRGVMISGVDSMQSRKEIWEKVKSVGLLVPLYIEARMGAEVSRIYSINPANEEQVRYYEETLYDDTQALAEPCTARAIIYNGFAIAALIANQVKKHAKSESLYKEIIFDMKTLTLMTQ